MENDEEIVDMESNHKPDPGEVSSKAMDTNHSDESIDEPPAKRPKLETADVGEETNPLPTAEAIANCPILMLSPDVLSKIIVFIPIAQWITLEKLDKNFRYATRHAWRQLRTVNMDREFLHPGNETDRSSLCESILQRLAMHSPILTSITVDFTGQRRRLENVVDFLESAVCRTNLKELQLLNVDHWEENLAPILYQFALSFVKGGEIRSPLQLERFVFTSNNHSLRIRLDAMDATRMTDLLLANAAVEPDQLTFLIERASNLRRIELAFIGCDEDSGVCCGQRLYPNRKLLMAISSHKRLTAMKFGSLYKFGDQECMDVWPEFIQMLESIGGQLTKLALEDVVWESGLRIDADELCETICKHNRKLQSIKFDFFNTANVLACEVFGLSELEEIYYNHFYSDLSLDAIRKIAQLPRLKHLFLRAIVGDDEEDDDDACSAFKCLANASLLTDLRIGDAREISAEILDKWSDGFASNLDKLMLDEISLKAEDEEGFIRMLEKAVHLRVLILRGDITDRLLKVIAKSCPNLEILGVTPTWSDQPDDRECTVQHLQKIVDHCPKLKRMSGFSYNIRELLKFPEYRKIGNVDMDFSKYDFDDPEYD